jgi:hypothetical protein
VGRVELLVIGKMPFDGLLALAGLPLKTLAIGDPDNTF